MTTENQNLEAKDQQETNAQIEFDRCNFSIDAELEFIADLPVEKRITGKNVIHRVKINIDYDCIIDITDRLTEEEKKKIADCL
jgi:hypothetical protein